MLYLTRAGVWRSCPLSKALVITKTQQEQTSWPRRFSPPALCHYPKTSCLSGGVSKVRLFGDKSGNREQKLTSPTAAAVCYLPNYIVPSAPVQSPKTARRYRDLWDRRAVRRHPLPHHTIPVP
ncbi:hypothetical protein BX600DRAFT_106047 [Xylariales sp. PMI_506]|nr:hypothetical protein BX600DRAFT_106047 [Xylariales sp. PMI_506]